MSITERITGSNEILAQDLAHAYGRSYFVEPSTNVTITIPTDFATIALSLTAIDRWIIPASSTVTILVPTLTLIAAVSINHPYGSRVKLLGSVTAVTATASAAGSVTGSSGNWAVPLTISVSSGISVGDYALIRNVTGTGRYLLFSGLCKVSAVAGTLVTVINTAKNAAWPTSSLTAADITFVKNILHFTAQSHGLKIDGPLGSIDNLIIEGTKLSGTIGMVVQLASEGMKNEGHVYCGTSCGITGWGDGGVYAQYNGMVDASYLCVADCLIYNVHAQHNGAIQINNGIVSGGTAAGISAHSGGDVSAESTISVGNGTYGIFAQPGGSILAPYSFTWANVSDGYRSAWGGDIRGQTLDSQYNGGYGGYCTGGGSIITPTSISSNNTLGGIYSDNGSSFDFTGTMSNNGTYGAYCSGGHINCGGATASSNGINGFTADNGGVILATSAIGASNATYLFSANNGGIIIASSASTSGSTCFSANGGYLNLSSATGTPVLSFGAGGRILDTSSVLRTGEQRIAKSSTYNSELTSGLILQNLVDPLKMLVAGYDDTRDYGYLQALKSTSGYKNLALNPNAGNVSIGLGATAPAARLHLAAGTTAASSAPLKLTAGTNMTAVENGAFEYDGTNLYFSTGGVRKTVTII